MLDVVGSFLVLFICWFVCFCSAVGSRALYLLVKNATAEPQPLPIFKNTFPNLFISVLIFLIVSFISPFLFFPFPFFSPPFSFLLLDPHSMLRNSNAFKFLVSVFMNCGYMHICVCVYKYIFAYIFPDITYPVWIKLIYVIFFGADHLIILS